MAAMAAGVTARQIGRSRERCAASRRAPENDVTQTRSQEAVRLSTLASGPIVPSSFRSMLKRSPGNVPIRSSSSGISSVPCTRAADTSFQVSLLTWPVRSVTRSSSASWKAISFPSEVERVSVSR